MISGNSVIAQVGKESAWGTAATLQRQVRFASEGFKYTAVKNQEPVLTGRIGASRYDLMGIRAEGSLSLLARPDDLGVLLLGALGRENAVSGEGAAKSHTFKAIDNNLTTHLPSFTFAFDRKVKLYKYTGCKINSFSFSAAPEDYLNLDIEVFARDEAVADSGLTPITPSALKAFKFHQGKVYFAGNTTAFGHITNISFDYNNNMENNIQTTGTGLHYYEFDPNTREITMELEMLYLAEAETFRQTWYKTDDILQVKLEFKSDEIITGATPYSLTIEVPACQVTECSASVGGSEGIRQSVSLVGIDNAVNDLITVTLVNQETALY
jgi:hypothetical protein